MRKISIIGLVASAILPAAALQADVRLPAIIGDNMAIQADKPVKLWGWADPGEKVTVTCGATNAPAADTDATGKWTVTLGPQTAGPVADIVIAGKNTITIKNVIAGEVWICSGQSNMEWPMTRTNNSDEEIAAAKYPSIRLFHLERATSFKPLPDCKGAWVECSPETVRDFSAVGYFFGRELHKELNMPVGLIETAWGGTIAEAWTSEPALRAVPEFKPILDRLESAPEDYVKAQARYEENLAKYQATTQAAAASGTPTTQRAPRQPQPPEKNPNLASVLYNAMIAPIVPYTVRGAVWYQGESNAGRAYQYRKLLPTMINDWRQQFGNNELAFGIVQLANFMAREQQPMSTTWAELREAQTMTAQNVPNCGMALAIDIGEEKDIHPRNKQEVGRRLALWAMGTVYGKHIEYSGPVYDAMKVEGNAIRITFKHADGLMARGGDLKGFAIAGEDKKFVWAEAKVDGSSVILKSAEVPNPVAVRYAWGNNPECNLYNAAGLPAVPFRTDDWPGVTVDEK